MWTFPFDFLFWSAAAEEERLSHGWKLGIFKQFVLDQTLTPELIEILSERLVTLKHRRHGSVNQPAVSGSRTRIVTLQRNARMRRLDLTRTPFPFPNK